MNRVVFLILGFLVVSSVSAGVSSSVIEKDTAPHFAFVDQELQISHDQVLVHPVADIVDVYELNSHKAATGEILSTKDELATAKGVTDGRRGRAPPNIISEAYQSHNINRKRLKIGLTAYIALPRPPVLFA
jgi:hypothetical protein